MKRFLKVIAIIFLMVFPFVNVFAVEEDTLLDTTLMSPAIGAREAEERISHSVFSADETIEASKIIDGINFVAGNNVTVNNFNEYGAYAGNSVTINSQVAKELFVAGNNVKITKEASLGRDAYIACSSLSIETNVYGNLYATGDSLVLENTIISGDANLSFNKITFKDNVVVNGTLKYSESTIVTGLDTATVNNVEKYGKKETETTTNSNDLLIFLISLSSLITVACVINVLFPKIYKNLNKKLEANRIFKNMGIGFLFLIACPIAFIVLVCTRIGVGLAFLLIALYVILLCLSLLPSMAIIGNNVYTKLLKRKDNSYLSIILGILIVKLVCLIPCVGGFISFLLMLIGLGYSYELLFKQK